MLKTIAPRVPGKSDHGIVLGLIATTFSVAAAFYQAYLVRERGWKLEDSRRIRFDSILSELSSLVRFPY